MPEELRYWDRVGFLVTREQAEDVASRMNTATGKATRRRDGRVCRSRC